MKVLVYDATFKHEDRWLRRSWATGARVYKTFGHVDAHHGATSWDDALRFLATHAPGESLDEIQFWGHGKWGAALIGEDRFTIASLDPKHAHYKHLEALRERLRPRGESLVWFRTCETVGARPGHDFAMKLGDLTGASVAGHTFVIAAFQSGLHGLRPGKKPHWSPLEGLEKGTPDAPESALWSAHDAPNTIHFMQSRVPPDWFG